MGRSRKEFGPLVGRREWGPLMEPSYRFRRREMVALTFVYENLAANLTNANVPYSDVALAGNNSARTPLPFPASVRALVVRGTDRTAGSATFTLVKNGNATDMAAGINASFATERIVYGGIGEFRYDAGDVLGMFVTTTAAWAPATGDYNVTVYVEFDLPDEVRG